jgi:ankyrin repeat protein
MKTLDQLPKDLQEQYTRELASISEEDSEDALTLLKWLTFPQRKIRVEEAVELLDVDYESEKPNFIPDEKVDGSDYVLGLCGSLVRTDVNKEGFNHLGEPAEVVTLTTSHATVLDFLKSREIKVSSLDPIYFTRESVNLQMAVTCLGYLHSLFELEPELDEEKLSRYPCARLCAEYWDDYYREIVAADSANVNRGRLNRLVRKLLDSRESTLKWVRLCDPDHDEARVNFKHQGEQLHSKLYYASLLGLTDIVTQYLHEGEDKNYTTKLGFGTPLVAAAYLGRTRIVECLLEAGADPTLSGTWYWGRPLAAAVEANRADIVKLLIKLSEVDVNCCRHGESWERKKALEEKLNRLGEGVDTSKPYEGFRSATIIDENDLYNDLIPSYLSPAEAEIHDASEKDTAGVSEQTMVYIAVVYGSIEVLDILLSYGADPNQIGGWYHTPLQAACTWGREVMAKKLLDSGAQCDIHSEGLGSPLYAACRKMASESIIRQMIDCGADVNHRCRLEAPGTRKVTMSTPLYAAAMFRGLNIVRLLLEHHADPNIQGCEEFDNAFQV